MAEIRVLIVDDMERVRQDLRTFLTLTGDIQIVGEAGDGLEAARLAETLCPQVILMDLEMPVMDGYESTRQIKTRCPSCKVIALTVHDYESARTKAHEAGVDAFLVKGASIPTFVQYILKKE